MEPRRWWDKFVSADLLVCVQNICRGMLANITPRRCELPLRGGVRQTLNLDQAVQFRFSQDHVQLPIYKPQNDKEKFLIQNFFNNDKH
jgi:hypothetical protein